MLPGPVSFSCCLELQPRVTRKNGELPGGTENRPRERISRLPTGAVVPSAAPFYSVAPCDPKQPAERQKAGSGEIPTFTPCYNYSF